MKGIIENSKKQRDLEKKSGRWLQESSMFDVSWYLNKEQKIAVDKLFKLFDFPIKYKKELFQNDFNVLMANLYKTNRKSLAISLNSNDWKQNRYKKISYNNIIEILQQLNDQKYINMKTGIQDNVNQQNNRVTRIWATDKLLEHLPRVPDGVLYKPVELVILRDDKKNLIDYSDTRETWRIRDILKQVNETNINADIRYNKDRLDVYLVAIFRNKFTLYGRLHTRGCRHYQGLSGDERQEITINGKSVVELDFKALHPYLLYAAEGIQYVGDPYSIIQPNPLARTFLKQILLFMLNSKEQNQAVKAANYWLFKNPDSKIQLEEIGINNTQIIPLINKFISAHNRIAHYFFTGKETGMKIMNKDSKIALDVINHFAKQMIPILSVHDSFIVEKQYKDELMIIMKNTYRKHTGFRCIVK